ncbi:methyl-accepting chemotaxis protein [Duganella sp. FT50W]|uniref:Methyl-accepting chemotaxis protein n=1 Tax=Duganella lactea TaxID=2692173 RepID=A0A6L8MQU6_9BURK|nr:methyl-accepting chemotaxis protein [Duganella lactea]MYM83328.1 methyl-accepting chemotaxis protein [Duganella lactea]
MLKKMRVGTKIIGGFVFVSVMGAIVAFVGILNMARINDLASEMYSNDLMSVSYVKEANINLIYVGRARGNFLLAKSVEEREEQRGRIQKYMLAVDENLRNAESLSSNEDQKKLFNDYRKESKLYSRLLSETMDLADSEPLQERPEALSKAMADVRSQANVLDDMLTAITKVTEKMAKEKAEETHGLYLASRTLMAGLVIGSLSLGIILGILISRNLERQLGGEPPDAVAFANKIAGGNLSADVLLGKGDRESLLFSIRSMRDSLANIVGQVRSGTDLIAAASSQIALGTLDLSGRTEQQAGALEQTASSMEELTSTVKANADNARRASNLAKSASDVAVKGGHAVSEVIETMKGINDSSVKISEIISVIDGIAFQTNILALNAAVEAARAGEQGRGFAVVASEVRNLAQRSAEAAKEIKKLIEDSVSKVGIGSEQVGRAGDTMREIVYEIKKVADIVIDIQHASSEQSAGIEQINQAIIHMDQVTQQNAALVEESAAASQSMQDQARDLSALVGVFQLGGEGHGAGKNEPEARRLPLAMGHSEIRR